MSAQRFARYAIVATLWTAGACASAGSGPAATASADLTPERDNRPRSGIVLTDADIARVDAGTAYGAILRLNPRFLKAARGSRLPDRPVYVDGIRWGGLEQLHELPASSVREIRFLNAVEATLRFGMDHSAGALVIVTKTGP